MKTKIYLPIGSWMYCLIEAIALGPGILQAQVNTVGGNAVSTSARVTAVADERSNSIIVSGSQEQLAAIAGILSLLDKDVQDLTELRVIRLTNADPDEMATLLASVFPDPTKEEDSRGSSPQFVDAAGAPGGNVPSANGAGGAAGEQEKKRGPVIAIPEPRTRSIIVSAAKQLMPQIESLVLRLDSNPAKKTIVKIYQMKNGTAAEVAAILHGIYDGVNAGAASTTQTDALQTRANQASQNQSTTGGFGLGGSGTGGGGGRY